jgi:Mrr N-terminal domain
MDKSIAVKAKRRRFILGREGLPDLSMLMLANVEALKELGGSARIDELLGEVVEREGISEEEQSYLMPDGRARRLNYYLSWARTYLKRGGAVENSSRGVWALTETGERITSRTQTDAIYATVNEEERSRAKAKRVMLKRAPAPEQDITVTVPEPLNQWRARLMDNLLALPPSAFERLAQRLLREAGFVKVVRCAASPGMAASMALGYFGSIWFRFRSISSASVGKPASAPTKFATLEARYKDGRTRAFSSPRAILPNRHPRKPPAMAPLPSI